MLDIEAVITAYLKAETGERIVGTTPSDITTPWVRLTMLDPAATEAETEHLLAYLVQLDCYAGEHPQTAEGQAEAFDLASEVRAALKAMQGGTHDTAVVTAVRFLSMPRIPDDSLEPARERWVITANIYAHPVRP